MVEQFVSQRIVPLAAQASARAASFGQPALPPSFSWGDEQFQIKHVVRTWRDTGPCRSGGGEMYVRKHWWEVITTDDRRMRLYFERQARSRSTRARWWLYSVRSDDPSAPGGAEAASANKLDTA